MAKSLLRTETIEYEGCKIVVQCRTLLSLINRDDLFTRLSTTIKHGSQYLPGYTDAVSQTTVFKGFSFVLPSPSASNEEHAAAFEQYIQLPLDFVARWINTITNVNVPPGTKPDLQPGVVTKNPLASEPDESKSSE